MTSDLITRLARRLFDRPLVQNSFRGEMVEEMVAMALGPEWQQCGSDWGSCDLVRASDGVRIQVKQTAVRQSWHIPGRPKARPRFSIARKTGRWEGPEWIDEPGRNADIFIFGLHLIDDVSADHRDPRQWLFFVVAERCLPDQDSIALSTLQSLADPVGIDELARSVETAAVAAAAR